MHGLNKKIQTFLKYFLGKFDYDDFDEAPKSYNEKEPLPAHPNGINYLLVFISKSVNVLNFFTI